MEELRSLQFSFFHPQFSFLVLFSLSLRPSVYLALLWLSFRVPSDQLEHLGSDLGIPAVDQRLDLAVDQRLDLAVGHLLAEGMPDPAVGHLRLDLAVGHLLAEGLPDPAVGHLLAEGMPDPAVGHLLAEGMPDPAVGHLLAEGMPDLAGGIPAAGILLDPVAEHQRSQPLEYLRVRKPGNHT